MVNAILYLLRTGCSWRQLPKDFPPWETVYWHFKRWRDDGSLDALHDTLRERVREAEGRDAQPTAAIIDALVLVTAANVQDRDGAQPALAAVRKAFPTISLVWADGGYAGKLVEWAKQTARIVLEIVRKPEGQRTFEVLPRRWVVERTLSWITKCRRLDHDYERLTKTSVAMVKWAMVGVMTRRLAPTPGRQSWTTQ